VVSRDADNPDPAPGPAQPGSPTLRLVRGPKRPAAAPTPPPALSAAPDARSLLRAIRRRWLLAVSIGALAAVGVAGALLVLLPQKYVAIATVQITAFPDMYGPNAYKPDFQVKLKTLPKRFRSRDVLLKALDQDRVRNLGIIRQHPDILAVITWLEDNLVIETQNDNELVTVSLPGDAPEELVVLLDTLTASYLSIVNGKEQEDREQKTKKLEKVAADVQRKIDAKEIEKLALTGGKATGSNELAMIYGAKIGQLGQSRNVLASLYQDLTKARARVKAIQDGRKPLTREDIPEHALTQVIEQDTVVRARLAQLGDMYRLIAKMDINGMSRLDPSRRAIEGKMAGLHEQLAKYREHVAGDVMKSYQKKLDAELAKELRTVQADVPALIKLLENQEKDVKALEAETSRIGFTTAQYERLKRELDTLSTELKSVDQQLEGRKLDQQSDPRVTKGPDAIWQVKDGKRRSLMLTALPLLALVGGVALVGLLEFRARRIDSAEEVAVGLGMRVVGAVPPLSARGGQYLAGEETYDHNLIESIDALRTTLLRSAREEPTKVVMVTSAVSGEGKTTLASNLAVSLARAGRRTLLIDCDLRRPALHQLFEQTLQPGFSEVLLGEMELADAVRPTTTDDHLWLLPAGQWDREVIQELAREGVGQLFKKLEQEFDFVVVDSHPVLPATDSLLLGQHADAVLVSLLRNVSQAPRVYAAYQRLATLGIRVFGAVVNGMPGEGYTGGCHYRYSKESVAA
jgi:capsular exopolysaccharide synthesis family protein